MKRWEKMRILEKSLNEELTPKDFNSNKIFYGYVYSVWGRKYKKRNMLYYTLSLYANKAKDKRICNLRLTDKVYFSIPKEFIQTKEFYCCISFLGNIHNNRSEAEVYIYDPDYIKLYDRDKAKLTILLSKLCDSKDGEYCTLFTDCDTKEEHYCRPFKCPSMFHEAKCLMEQSEEYKEILTIESEDLQLSKLTKLLDKYWSLMW